jgi:hypothetical protein
MFLEQVLTYQSTQHYIPEEYNHKWISSSSPLLGWLQSLSSFVSTEADHSAPSNSKCKICGVYLQASCMLSWYGA